MSSGVQAGRQTGAHFATDSLPRYAVYTSYCTTERASVIRHVVWFATEDASRCCVLLHGIRAHPEA